MKWLQSYLVSNRDTETGDMSTEDSLAWLVVSHSPSVVMVSSDLLRWRDIGDDVSGSKHLVVNEQYEEGAGEQSS